MTAVAVPTIHTTRCPPALAHVLSEHLPPIVRMIEPPAARGIIVYYRPWGTLLSAGVFHFRFRQGWRHRCQAVVRRSVVAIPLDRAQ